MESDILNELFDLMELRAEGESAVKDLIDYIKNHKHYEVFLEAMADVRRDLFVDDEIHGISHNERVALLACVIGMREGLSESELRLLLEAAKYHDIGRKDKVKNHSKISAEKIEELRYEVFSGFTDEEVRVIQALSEAHGVEDELNDSVISTYNVPNVESCRKLLNILKDADALDRVRLPRFGFLDESRLRVPESRGLVDAARNLLEEYNVARTTAKYDRGAVEYEFDSSIFDIDSYNVIEDDEFYYVFRTLNEANEDELDDEYEKCIRTSRERAERRHEEVKYTADSEISLTEIYDNIKFTHGDKDTNCISFSTNANVSLDYRNDRFVMLKVPKAELGQLVVSGKYMLEEMNRVIEEKIAELLEDEQGNKEILSLISQINSSVTPDEVANIAVRAYRKPKTTQEKYTGTRNSILTASAVRKRFTPKQYLTEEQQFEYNRLIAKLTVLETRGKIGSLLPTQLTNTALISSLGTAFSSSEMIHYQAVDKANVVEVSKENMEMFALLQQAEELPGINKEEIAEIKRDFLDAVQSGYELRMKDGRIVYSNSEHRVDLGEIGEYSSIFDEIEESKATPIRTAYQVFRNKSEEKSEKVIPYVKGKAAIDFTRKLALARLKSEEYWKIIGKISPGYEDLIQAASRNTVVTNSDIVSRMNDSGAKLIESVNIDIADTNIRSLFSNKEIYALWEKVKGLSDEEIEKVISEDFDFFRNGYFDTIIEGKSYPQGENEYYVDTIVDGLDLSKVYNFLRPGSDKIEKVKERIREKLNGVDAKKLYVALYNSGIPEAEISNYVVNMILDDGIGKEYDSFEKLVSQPTFFRILTEYKENLKPKVSAIRLNNFMGIRDNDYVVAGTQIKLRDYQKEALSNIGKIYEKGKRFAGVKLPTGAGKSFVAMSEMMNRQKESMVYFAPQEEILFQVQRHIVKYILNQEILSEKHIEQLASMSKEERKAFLENKIYNPTVDANKLLNDLNKPGITDEEKTNIINKLMPRRTDKADDVMDAIHTVFPHLDMCCYQSLTASKYEELAKKKIDYFVFDELHRTGADTWKKKIDDLLKIQKDAQILGITATPVRDVDGVDTMEEMAKNYGGYTTEEIINKEYYAAEMTLIDAMQRKIVVEPIIVPFNNNLVDLPEYQEIVEAVEELEKTGSDPKLLKKLKFNLSQMNEIVGQSSLGRNDQLVGIDKVLASNIGESKKNGRFIVFIPQKPSNYQGKTEDYVKEKIAETSKYFEGVNREMMIEYLLSNREGADKANAKAIADFESIDDDRLKLLYAINKLNEGVHVENISGEIMLRPIGAGSNILYFQQIGRVIYAIDPENPPSEDDIPIIFDVYNNYIARDLDKEANYSTTISDLSRLQEIVNWINRHEALPDINSYEKNEVNKAEFLRKIQKKYAKYLEGINNPNLTESEIFEIQKILELAKSFNLFELDLPDRTNDETAFDLRVRTFEVVGEQKRFLDIYQESKKEINKSAMRNKASDAIKIREGVGILKILSSYGLAITDESFEKLNKNKNDVSLANYITSNFDVATSREILNELKMSLLDAEDVEIYRVYDYLRQSFMSSKPNVRNYFNYYDITDLRKCGILKENGRYIPVIDEFGFVHASDPFGDGHRAPSDFVSLNIMTGTKYDEQGYNINGYDIDGYDREGYDETGYDKLGFKKGEDKNKFGFTRDGHNEITNSHLDINGFDIHGNYWKPDPADPDDIHKRINTGSNLNEYGFDRDGNYYELDENGELVNKGKVDKLGFILGQKVNEAGFKRDGTCERTGKPWDEYGFDIHKKYWRKDPKNPDVRIKTDDTINEYGFARDGYYYEKDESGNLIRKGKTDPLGFKFDTEYNKHKFNRDGIHQKTGKLYNENGFDMYGFYWEIDYKTGERRKTDRTLDPGFFDIDGNYWETDSNGVLVKKGKVNSDGKKQGQGIDKHGFKSDGTHFKTNKLWDPNGFDIDGYYWVLVEGTEDERVPTNDILNEYGFKRNGKYCEKNENGEWIEIGDEDRLGFTFGIIVNERGFARDRRHGATGQYWDENGYDMNGFYWEKDPENPENRINTGKYLDPYGFNFRLMYCEYNEDGTLEQIGFRDRRGFSFGDEGVNKDGFYRTGIHKNTKKLYNEYYFDIDGNYWEQDPENPFDTDKRIKTDRKYDEYGKDISGAAAQGVEQKEEDRYGFRRGKAENDDGFLRNGLHKVTGKPWNTKYFGIDGYYWAQRGSDKNDRYKTNRKFNDYNVDKGGYYCIEYQGKSVRLHKYRNKYWESVRKQESTVRNNVTPFEDGAYDEKGFWWKYDSKTKTYTPTNSKFHPKKGWDKDGYDRNRKYVAHDKYGFMKSGRHTNGTYHDDRGFDAQYIHSVTKQPYDESYFDIDGFYWEYDSFTERRIKTDSIYNELGITFDGSCDEDIYGYDDIGMQNGTTNVNEKFKKKVDRQFVAREGEEKAVFRRTDRGYYYLDSQFKYNPEDGLDYYGCAPNGYNVNGEKRGATTTVYKIMTPKDDKYFETYDETDEVEEYEYMYSRFSPRKMREDILEERRYLLAENFDEDTVLGINTSRKRYNFASKRYPRRAEATQYVRDLWLSRDYDIRDEDGEYLVDPWDLDSAETKDELRWQAYVAREELLAKRLKKEVELDGHGFDSEGYFYKTYEIGGKSVAEPTLFEYDHRHFDKEGFYWEVDEETGEAYRTERKYDDRGFDQNGFYHDPEKGVQPTLYNPEGYDKDGFDRNGFNRRGLTRANAKENAYGFRADGTCSRNNGLRHDANGFLVDGRNIYTGTYVDIFGRTMLARLETPHPNNIVNAPKNLNAYGINPKNGKNADGFIDPTVRFARYYYAEVLETGRDPDEVINSIANAYRIDPEEMKVLAEQKLYIALRGFPKLRDEIRTYYEKGKEMIGKNYDMHIRVAEAHERRRQAMIDRLSKKDVPEDDGTGIDDDL